ncbi:MAG: ATP-binding cassette domain-containing protein [Bacteroidetes bacterium]|jgi:ABC-type multidrug transport system ATPase subunit|nr:ATP-binding cassette domain-containing protein [Bacteroidota bacterium]
MTTAASDGTAGDAVVVCDLGKQFGAVEALRDVAFRVAPGEVFGVIGPDGAGKTTLFRILTSLLVPDAGTAHVLGLDVVDDYRALRRRLGYMPGRFSLYTDLTVAENLRFFATIFGTRVEAEYDYIAPIYRQIEPFRNRRAGALSGGMKQKLALSCALVHRPDLLVLDEPTTGVDAVSRREFWDMLGRLREGGLTILVATPYMDEASRCDRVALMQDGRLLDIDTPEQLSADFDRPLLAVRGPDRYRLLQALRTYPHAQAVHPFGEDIHVTDARPQADPEDLRQHLAGQGFEDVEIRPIRATIEDRFMALMTDEA